MTFNAGKFNCAMEVKYFDSLLFRCDISSSESIHACFQEITSLGINRLDVLVNNAGVSNKNHPDDACTDVDRYTVIISFTLKTVN